LKNSRYLRAGDGFTGPQRVPVHTRHFLDQISFLTQADRDQLKSIDADSPVALYAAIQASRISFERILDQEKLNSLEKELYSLISPAERNILIANAFSPPPSGAIVTHGPSELGPPGFDIEERDRLFEKLQHLRSINSTECEVQAREVEQQLNALLDGRFKKSQSITKIR